MPIENERVNPATIVVLDPARVSWPEEMRKYGAHVLEDTGQILDILPIGLPPLEEVAF